MASARKNAVGMFPDRNRVESILKAADVSEWMVFDRNYTASLPIINLPITTYNRNNHG